MTNRMHVSYGEGVTPDAGGRAPGGVQGPLRGPGARMLIPKQWGGAVKAMALRAACGRP